MNSSQSSKTPRQELNIYIWRTCTEHNNEKIRDEEKIVNHITMITEAGIMMVPLKSLRIHKSLILFRLSTMLRTLKRINQYKNVQDGGLITLKIAQRNYIFLNVRKTHRLQEAITRSLDLRISQSLIFLNRTIPSITPCIWTISLRLKWMKKYILHQHEYPKP